MTDLDPSLAAALQNTEWQYAEHDPAAAHKMERRIAEYASQPGFIVYSDLVEGINFHLPQINGGKGFCINTSDWRGIDRRIVGDFLGYISMLSYLHAGFVAGALVVGKESVQPSAVFFEWMHEKKILPNLNDETVIPFWSDHFKAGQRWYRQHPNEPLVPPHTTKQ